MVRFECPWHWTLSIPEKSWKNFRLKFAQWPQAWAPSMKVKSWNCFQSIWLNRMQMVQFEWPWNWAQNMKVKSWKCFRNKFAQQAVNGPLWMHQAVGPKHESKNLEKFKNKSQVKFECPGTFLGSNWLNRLQMVQFECHRHWAPSMKVKSWKNFRTKFAQQAANGPVWMP